MSDNAMNLYIRKGLNKGDPASGRFTFEDVDCILVIHPENELTMHRAKADGTMAKAIAGKGRWHKEEIAEDSKDPTLRGLISTAKGSVFELAAWLKDDEGDQYYSAVLRPRIVRNGFLP